MKINKLRSLYAEQLNLYYNKTIIDADLAKEIYDSWKSKIDIQYNIQYIGIQYKINQSLNFYIRNMEYF